MPCCDTCACLDEPFECLAVRSPSLYPHFAAWCRSGTVSQRGLVRDLSGGRVDYTPAVPDPAAEATRRLLARCPFWIRVGCGCGENRCAAGAGLRGIVFPPDCEACTIGL